MYLKLKKVSCHVFLEIEISTKTNVFIVWNTEIFVLVVNYDNLHPDLP